MWFGRIGSKGTFMQVKMPTKIDECRIGSFLEHDDLTSWNEQPVYSKRPGTWM